MKVAVTGASGFVGRHLVRGLRAHGHSVRSLVRASRRRPVRRGVCRRPVHRRAARRSACRRRRRGSRRRVSARLVCGPGRGAEAPRGECPRDARRRRILGVRTSVRKAVVFSSNVYRHGTDAVTEEAPTYPSVHAPYYLMSKFCAEVWADHFDRTGKLQTASLRLASVYGPGLERGMIPTFTATLVQGKPITVKDGGRYRSDLVFVGDVVDATERALLRDVHGVFNVGSGTTSSSSEIAEALVALMGASRDLLIVELPASNAVLFGFAPLDVTRAREQLGYAPRAIRDALGAYVDWHRSRR